MPSLTVTGFLINHGGYYNRHGKWINRGVFYKKTATVNEAQTTSPKAHTSPISITDYIFRDLGFLTQFSPSPSHSPSSPERRTHQPRLPPLAAPPSHSPSPDAPPSPLLPRLLPTPALSSTRRPLGVGLGGAMAVVQGRAVRGRRGALRAAALDPRRRVRTPAAREFPDGAQVPRRCATREVPSGGVRACTTALPPPPPLARRCSGGHVARRAAWRDGAASSSSGA